MQHKRSLNTATVVQTAADLLNTEGVEALTLHRLARRLDVQPPSLYNHVDGLPGLYHELALVNVQGLESRLVAAVLGKSGAEAVQALAHAYRAYIKENPGLYTATLRTSSNQAQPDVELQAVETHLVEISLAILAPFGLAGDDSLHALRGLRSLVHGFATLEISGGFGMPLDLDESFRRLVEMFLFALQRSTGSSL